MPCIGCRLGSAYQRLIGQLDEALRRHGLGITSGEYLILRSLFSTDGLQQCEIADMVAKDKSSVSRSVAALVRKGLVRTEPVSYKCNKVWITDKARDIKPSIMLVADERHEALCRLAPHDDLEAFARVLEAILK